MDVTLHPDLGLFPVGTTVKAYKRSALTGVIPGSFPGGAPSGTEDASAAVASDGSLAFTGLTARISYFGYALVSGQHRYFGFTPGAVSPAQPTKLSYDPDTDTVNVEAANFTVDGSPVGGGSTAPTDILVLGTDVPLINGWLAPDPDTDGEPIGRIYKQGGRVHFFGSIVAPGGSGAPFVVPAGYLPYDFGDDVLGIDPGFAIVSNWNTVRFLEVSNGGPVNISPAPNAGVLVQLDGVSWPLPA